MFEEINTDAAEPTMKNPIDFAGLKAVNEDIIAWLKVGAIDISYPVTQGKDNDYYLHNTFENQPNIAGCIFMDHGCKKIFPIRTRSFTDTICEIFPCSEN